MKKKLLSLLLSLAMLTGLAAPALAAETAEVIRLQKTTGDVSISKSSGKSVSLISNMRLYSGYHVTTDQESYAWINLDDSKLLKEDAGSEVEVRKDGKKLEVLVSSGNIFFDVAKPLEDDESMCIRTSTMAVGIRGTSGYVQVSDGQISWITVLEGEVACSVEDPVTGQLKTEPVYGGERAKGVVYDPGRTGDKCDIIKEKITPEDIPGFVLTDLTRDIPLCDKIKAATGLDIPRDLASVAGGDPSGREPDGEHATPEVLDEADRREDEDEADLRERLEEIEKELEKQPGGVSPSKVPEKAPVTPPPVEDDDDDDDDDSAPAPAPEPEPEPEPEPATYSITFDANGGLVNGANSSIVQTDTTGKVTAWPSDPVYGAANPPTPSDGTGLTFSGWFTAKAGGTQMDETTVFTADTQLYAHWDGWYLDPGGTLVVAGKGPIEDCYIEFTIGTGADPTYQYRPPWSIQRNNIIRAVILEGVTSIGGARSESTPDHKQRLGSFDSYSNLASVVIPEGVTYIGDDAFYHCTSLTDIAIPSSVTRIGIEAFSECASLTSVEIPSSVTSIGEEAFYRCTSLTSVTIPSGVTTIETGTFMGCSGLTSVEIPSGVISIGREAFDNCASLTKVTIPSSVTTIGNYAFFSCTNLIEAIIPSSVTSIGTSAFNNCTSLTEVTIPSGVTTIEMGTFAGSGLTKVTIPSSVTTIMQDAFENCTRLTTINFDGTQTQWGAISMGASAFPTGKTVTCSDGTITT